MDETSIETEELTETFGDIPPRLQLADQLAQMSEEFENDQGKLVAFIRNRDRGDLINAFEKVDWPQVIKTWEDDTLWAVIERGTNIQFLRSHGKYMHGLVMQEAIDRGLYRTPDVTGHGMAEDGTQK